jgi:hypothetical protein
VCRIYGYFQLLCSCLELQVGLELLNVQEETIYTLHGHKLRFYKELKAQGEQRIEISLVSGHSFVQAV